MSKPAQPHQVETRSLVLNAIILASYAVVRPILLDAPMARAPKSEAELDSAWAKELRFYGVLGFYLIFMVYKTWAKHACTQYSLKRFLLEGFWKQYLFVYCQSIMTVLKLAVLYLTYYSNPRVAWWYLLAFISAGVATFRRQMHVTKENFLGKGTPKGSGNVRSPSSTSAANGSNQGSSSSSGETLRQDAIRSWKQAITESS